MQVPGTKFKVGELVRTENHGVCKVIGAELSNVKRDEIFETESQLKMDEYDGLVRYKVIPMSNVYPSVPTYHTDHMLKKYKTK